MDLLETLARGLAGRYALDRQVGEGGMATVFLAQDLKHRRQVAIKVLRAELAASIGPERFLREIELAAQLQHPHIVPVYDSGETGGLLYYVMPYIEGESLRDLLDREAPLPLERAVQIAREAASGLGFAHARGVVHRDIKPENIMLSGGHAVVADFGIARPAAAAGGRLTQVGMAIGTPAYMSPEQATAEDVDARSDQYSLACVFYEMVTGRQPFAGTTIQAVLKESITGPRPRLSTLQRAAPPGLDPVVQKALDAEPGKRFDSISQFADALAAGAAGGVVARETRRYKLALVVVGLVAVAAVAWAALRRPRTPVVEGAETIAVLPFSTSGAGVETLGEGMVDLISANLDAVGAIRTIEPRRVLQAWRKRSPDGAVDQDGALGIARDLAAGSVVMGSVVGTGANVRIGAELLSADGTRLARAQIDGAADSVFVLADRLSLALLREVWRSSEPPSSRPGAIQTTSIEALRAYLQGTRLLRLARWDSAQAAFEQAIAADSTFAMAYAHRATAMGWLGNYGAPEALQSMRKAAQYAAGLPEREASLIRANLLYLEGDLAAVDSARVYTSRWPADADGWNLLGEAQVHGQNILALDPSTLREPFDRVLQIDSSLAPAAIHPTETSLGARDSAGFSRYLRLMEQAGDIREARTARAGGVVVWGGQRDSAVVQLAGRLNIAGYAMNGILRGPAVTGDTVLDNVRQLRSAITRPMPLPLPEMMHGVLLAGLGRLAEARAIADSIRPKNQQLAGAITMTPMLGGFAPDSSVDRMLSQIQGLPQQNPFSLYLQAAFLLMRKDVERAAPLVRRLSAMDTAQIPRPVRGVPTALAGWLALARGDTTAGLQQIEAGMRQAGAGHSTKITTPLRIQWALALAARPATRAEGIRRLRHGFDSDPEFIPISFYYLGRLHEAAGEKEEAVQAYGQFIRLWNKPDPLVAGRLEEAKRALAALTAEPRN